MKTPAEELRGIADALDTAGRQGSDQDTPEGARVITMSDTLAREFAGRLRRLAARAEGHREGCAALSPFGMEACTCR